MRLFFLLAALAGVVRADVEILNIGYFGTHFSQFAGLPRPANPPPFLTILLSEQKYSAFFEVAVSYTDYATAETRNIKSFCISSSVDGSRYQALCYFPFVDAVIGTVKVEAISRRFNEVIK